MKYTYHLSAQGRGGETQYVHLSFDRQISDESVYRQSENLCPKPGTLAAKVANAVAGVNGVINGPRPDILSSEHIGIDGNNVTVKFHVLDTKRIPEFVKTLVKRIQRIIAKDEGRQLVARNNIKAWMDKRNTDIERRYSHIVPGSGSSVRFAKLSDAEIDNAILKHCS